MRSIPLRLLSIWTVIGLAAAGTLVAAPAYYVVFELDEKGHPEPVFAKLVQLPASPGAPAEAAVEDARIRALHGEPVRALRLERLDGEVIFRDVVDIPQWTRGEFHGKARPGGGFEIEGHRFPADRPAFVARVPAEPGARLIVDGPTRSEFDMDALAASAPQLRLASIADRLPVIHRARAGGGPDNRVDLLIMGDGYTSAQAGLFTTEATNLENTFLGITPYAEYRNFVNVTQLFNASSQSGADHPPYNASCSGSNTSCCSDPAAQSDPLAGTYVNTVFGARFCSFQIHRLLVVNNSAVLAAASAVPTWDVILVVVNDSTYGGSGGSIPVTSTNGSAVDIARHEYGHSFTDLADEYESPFPGYPQCSDIAGAACEANVTNETNASLLKWAPWVLPSTPIPTPETSQYNNAVGLFEGARYFSSGMYRPRRSSCLMRSLGVPFGEICAQEYVRVLYAGGWGTPFNGVDPIEPGTEVPPTGGVVDGTSGVNFSVDLLQPIGGPALDVSWWVDGNPQAGETGSSYAFSRPNGAYTVEVRVEDPTALVHPAMSLNLLESSRTWTVEVGPVDPGEVDGLRLARSATPGSITLQWNASCSATAVDYSIYEGTIGFWPVSHKIKDCSDDGTPLIEDVVPAAFSAYYLVVPQDGIDEGSYGRDSNGTERGQGGSVCVATQSLGGCP